MRSSSAATPKTSSFASLLPLAVPFSPPQAVPVVAPIIVSDDDIDAAHAHRRMSSSFSPLGMCTMCTEYFCESIKTIAGGEVDRRPRVLKCNHVFCSDCLMGMLDRERCCPKCSLSIESPYVDDVPFAFGMLLHNAPHDDHEEEQKQGVSVQLHDHQHHQYLGTINGQSTLYNSGDHLSYKQHNGSTDAAANDDDDEDIVVLDRPRGASAVSVDQSYHMDYDQHQPVVEEEKKDDARRRSIPAFKRLSASIPPAVVATVVVPAAAVSPLSSQSFELPPSARAPPRVAPSPSAKSSSAASASSASGAKPSRSRVPSVAPAPVPSPKASSVRSLPSGSSAPSASSSASASRPSASSSASAPSIPAPLCCECRLPSSVVAVYCCECNSDYCARDDEVAHATSLKHHVRLGWPSKNSYLHTTCRLHHQPRDKYCLECAIRICERCVSHDYDHRRHTTVDVASTMVDIRDQIRRKLDTVDHRTSSVESTLRVSNQSQNSVGPSVVHARAEIQRESSELVAAILERQKVLLGEVDKFESSSMKSHSSMKKRATSLLERADAYRSTLFAFLASSDDDGTAIDSGSHRLLHADHAGLVQSLDEYDATAAAEAGAQVRSIKFECDPIAFLSSARKFGRIVGSDRVMTLRRASPAVQTQITVQQQALQPNARAATIIPGLAPAMQAQWHSFMGDIALTNANMIYQASKDGFHCNDFFRCSSNRGPTLMIIKTAGSNYVFGAYSAVPWSSPAAAPIIVADASKRSFIFSLTNRENQPFVLPLADERSGIVIREGAGPMFGNAKAPSTYPDLILMVSGRLANAPNGNCVTAPSALSAYQPSAMDGSGFDYEKNYNVNTLAGSEYFAADEIEVYMLPSFGPSSPVSVSPQRPPTPLSRSVSAPSVDRDRDDVADQPTPIATPREVSAEGIMRDRAAAIAQPRKPSRSSVNKGVPLVAAASSAALDRGAGGIGDKEKKEKDKCVVQ